MRILLTIIFAFLALATKAQTLHFHQLTVKDGLMHNAVITLGQDSKGDIWVATHNGLYRYDRRQFTALPSDGLPDKRIDRMNCAADGTMWVQCFEKHQLVSRYDTLSDRFVTYKVSELSDSVRQQAVKPLNRTFADPRSSRVWSIEKRQLWQTDTLHPDSQFAYTDQTAIDAGLKDETIYTLLLDRQGILWAGSANNGLFFADTRQSHYHRLICHPSPIVRATCVDRQGTLWIAIGDQQLLNRTKNETFTNHIDYPMTDSVEGRRVRAIVEDGKGRIWMGTHDGLYVKAPTSDFQRVTMGDARPVSVFCLCHDANGQLWIGSDRGLFLLLLDEQQPNAQLVDSTITHIGKIAVEKERMWIATENGLYCRTDNQTTQWFTEATHQIITDARGQTWVGTDNGLLRITDQGVQPVSTAIDGHIVKDLLCWRDFLWCSYEQGICCVNIYTGQSTLLHTEHNEYLDGSACLDANTSTLYFGGTLGIDCFQADDLDEHLRSGVSQLWLEEVNEELSIKREEPSSSAWPYIVLVFIGCCCGFSVTYYLRRRKNQPANDAPQEKEPKGPSPFILKATAIAEAHIADADFTAEQMAQELAMSRTKLFLLMKKETNKAVMEFVRDIRLDYAAQQLAASTPVNEVYMACGFSDPSSFRRSFVKKYGINPSQYRQSANSK